jgi:hypothetical protein
MNIQTPIRRHSSLIANHGGITRVVVNRHTVKKGTFPLSQNFMGGKGGAIYHRGGTLCDQVMQ